MKKGSHLTKYSLIALLIAIVILGDSVAFLTFYYYQIIVRGILGFATIYLVLTSSKLFSKDEKIETLLLNTSKIRDFISTFIGSLICGWAGMQIVQMLFFIVKNR